MSRTRYIYVNVTSPKFHTVTSILIVLRIQFIFTQITTKLLMFETVSPKYWNVP